MTQTFTENDLIRFVYKETNPEESRLITEALWDDPKLRAEYGELCLLKESMDGAMKSPSDRVVNRILDYSKSLDLPPMLQ